MRFLSALRRRLKKVRESGQSLVEFTLVLPVFLFLLSGLVEIGDTLNSYLTVIDSSRDAARLGSKGLATDAEIRGLVGKDMERLRDPFNPTSGVTVARNTMPGDTSVKVRVCYDHQLIFPLPGFIPNPIHVCSSTTMRSISYQ
jgi:Flp pilus assembly protein TadG